MREPASRKRKNKQREVRHRVIAALLQADGPLTAAEVARACRLKAQDVRPVLGELTAEAQVVESGPAPGRPGPRYCWWSRAEELRKRRSAQLKREFEPVSVERYVDFILRWQHVHPEARLKGPAGLREALERLQLHDDLIRLWERDILPARVADYDPSMLDRMISSGEVIWGTFNFRFRRALSGRPGRRGLQLCLRRHQSCTVDISDDLGADDGKWHAELRAVRRLLAQRGAMRLSEIASTLDLDEDLTACLIWHLVWAGEVTATDLVPLHRCDLARLLEDALAPRRGWGWGRARRALERRGVNSAAGAWRLIRADGAAQAERDCQELTLDRARLILARYGVISASLGRLYENALPAAEFRQALKVLALKGEAVSGKFVRDARGTQYALPEALEALKSTPSPPSDGPIVLLNRHDPANLFTRGIDAYYEDGRKIRFGRAGRWYLFVQGGRMIAVMYATDSGRGHFAMLYFRFTHRKFRDRTPKIFEVVTEHFRGRMPAAGYNELRVECRWDGEQRDGKTFKKAFDDFGFENRGGYMSLKLTPKGRKAAKRPGAAEGVK